ncbi:unnamed protein product [Caenorhabditis angaria]|uniref:Uncharacterized protein n=1 Tax=Caenorhabditis angaria TaxID=860376 RepID=A0A9P1MUF2_9PELO|nr:unnamed protein product [Caenorhabditis angaria]
MICILAGLLPFPNGFYQNFREYVGAEITLINTLNYLGPQFICVLMTVHRVFIIFAPMNRTTFSHERILIYGTGILAITFISLIIPYFSECRINYSEPELSFASNCAPNRHVITLIQNKYLIILPVTCMTINLIIVGHLRALREGLYEYLPFFQKTRPEIIFHMSTFMSNQTQNENKKREINMIRQTVATTVYLSLYEFIGLLIRMFPGVYSNIPVDLRSLIVFARFIMAFLINFFVYFVETKNVRKSILKYLGYHDKPQPVTSVKNLEQ